jgi:hypothetical protein
MIYYVVSQRHAYTVRSFINDWAGELLQRIKVLSYESLPYSKSFRQGTYIFSDIERLTREQAKILSAIWEELSSAGNGIRLLNHPMRSMRRYKLLRTLYEQHVNSYNIYRLTDCQSPKQFPVFIRGENDHSGSLTPLLGTQAMLDSAIDALSRRGERLRDKVMIEFCNTADSNGIFRKYSAYIIGDRIIPQHMMFGQRWMLKSVDSLAKKKTDLYEERRYLRDNPHQSQLHAVFQLAGINYGRIDYSISDDGLQIWEINTNPTLMHIAPGPPRCASGRVQFVQKMISALEALDSKGNAEIEMPVRTIMSHTAARSKLFFSFAIALILDKYCYIRQWTVPRTRRMAQHVLWWGKTRIKRFKDWGLSNARD